MGQSALHDIGSLLKKEIAYEKEKTLIEIMNITALSACNSA